MINKYNADIMGKKSILKIYKLLTTIYIFIIFFSLDIMLNEPHYKKKVCKDLHRSGIRKKRLLSSCAILWNKMLIRSMHEEKNHAFLNKKIYSFFKLFWYITFQRE